MLYILLIIGVMHVLRANEYLYPVAAINDDPSQIYLVQQKSCEQLQVWLWNSRTNQVVCALLSTWIPAGLRVLPGGSGFSFLHNDRLRIKTHHKRSPRSISFSQPLYALGTIEWTDDTNFYGYARFGPYYQIFQSSTDGQIFRIISDNTSDYLYPQKIGNQFFCIKRTVDGQNSIVKTTYSVQFRQYLQPIQLLGLGNRRIAFLRIASSDHGFFIEHPVRLDQLCETIPFTCCEFVRTDPDEQYRVNELFTFNIPRAFILGMEQQRVYEAPLPFLPCYTSSIIYYVDYDVATLLCHLKTYELSTKKQTCIYTCCNGQMLLGLLSIENMLFCGSNLNIPTLMAFCRDQEGEYHATKLPLPL